MFFKHLQSECKDQENWCKFEPKCDYKDVKDKCPELCGACCKDEEIWCKYEPKCDYEDVRTKCPKLCGACKGKIH